MSKRPEDASRQPESLATFAAASRSTDKVSPNGGLDVTDDTAPIPGDLAAQHDAATKVLREGVMGTDQGAMEAIDALPDRTRSADKT
jgi:hypothetical protein